MNIAALIVWLVTAAFGITMVGIWFRNGGTDSTHLRPPVLFSHVALAVGGLVVWIVYMFTDVTALAWIAFVDLLVVAAAGDLMAFRWTKDHRVATHAVGSMSAAEGLAEQRIPPVVVLLHGVVAVATVVLVLLAALGVGGS